jgi:hypothetical protein
VTSVKIRSRKLLQRVKAAGGPKVVISIGEAFVVPFRRLPGKAPSQCVVNCQGEIEIVEDPSATGL